METDAESYRAPILPPPPPPPRTLAPGIYVQVYRAKLPGSTHQQRLDLAAKQLDALAALGCAGIAWHGFSMELVPDVFAPLAALCHDRGMRALAAFGLDGTDPAGKGARIGAVAAMAACDGVVFDAEGAWDAGARDKARAMGEAFRAAAPAALALTQPWPLPQYHAGFPYEQFAAFTDVVAPQFYVNDWARQYGARRYVEMWPRFEATWETLEGSRLASTLLRPRVPTIEGAGWSDIPGDLADCLASNPTCLVWSEPWPDAAFMTAWSAVCGS